MYKILFLLIIVLLFTSCSEKEDVEPDGIKISSGGVFILSEGNYSAANSSLSYYYPETGEIENSLFYRVNNVPLGDVAQSMTIHESGVYIVINNSGIVFKINRETLEFEGKISGLVSPREMIFINNHKAYISDLYRTEISIVNPSTFEIIGSIEVGKSSDCMIKSDNKIMIANWSAYNQTKLNNSVMIVNSESDILTDSIVVGIEPNSMVVDKDGFLWVLCSGGFMNDELPSLWKVNTVTLEIEKQFTFSNIMQSPDNLCIVGDSLYFLNNGIFVMSVHDQFLPEIPLIIEGNKNYYSLGVDPVNNEIYVSDALDYNQNGMIYRYNLTGDIKSSFEAGIIPGSFGFNY